MIRTAEEKLIMTDKTGTRAAETAEKDQKIAAAKQLLKESGLPAELIAIISESVLVEMAESKNAVRVVNLTSLIAERKCTHARVKITDHPDTPGEPLGENGLGNLELVIIMLCGWLLDDPESFRRFRRFAMRKAARADAELAEIRPDSDGDPSVTLFREMEQSFFRDLMHWFR